MASCMFVYEAGTNQSGAYCRAMKNRLEEKIKTFADLVDLNVAKIPNDPATQFRFSLAPWQIFLAQSDVCLRGANQSEAFKSAL